MNANPRDRIAQAPLSRTILLDAEGVKKRIIGADELLQTWDDGIPTIHVYVGYDADNGNSDHPPNCKLVLDARWASDSGGGQALIDAARGSSFTLGASMRSLSIEGIFAPIDAPTPPLLVRPANANISVVVGGHGTLGGARPTYATPRYVTNPGVLSPVLAVPIPNMAVRGRIVTTGEVPRGDINLLTYTGGVYTAPQAIQNGDDGWLEVGGATFYNLQNVGALATRAYVIWELAL